MSMGGVSIREMTARDVDSVVQLAARLKEAPQWAANIYVGMLNPTAVPRRIALVAEKAEGGAAVGFAVASLMPPEAELESIAVAKACQRQGIARRLLCEMEARLRNEGVATVLLEVRASNGAAQGLYRALGFVESGRRPRYYADPVEDAVLYRLGIGEPGSAERA